MSRIPMLDGDMLAPRGPSDAPAHLGCAMTDVEARTFGEVLKHERLAAGLTQEELAERASLSARAISDLERGVKHTPRRQTIELLADALRLSDGRRTALAAAARPHRESATAPDLPNEPPSPPHPPGVALAPCPHCHRESPVDVEFCAGCGQPLHTAPLSSADFVPRPNNLLAEVSTFVGREWELAGLPTQLATARLMTLTGPGGVGKTHLALRLATRVQALYPQGVWLVELAPVAMSRLVPQAVATALGVREDGRRPILESLQAHLASRELLLVLDNCEHLIGACAVLADALLRACSGLRILATSREPLGIAGELLWRVPSLSIPERMTTYSLESLRQYDATRLFAERAAFASPGFVLTQHNAAAVAEICRRLDGLPLAIELAAARVRVLSPDQIAARLDDRFSLLIGGSRTAEHRQQTLRATLEWSYDLLESAEGLYFERLGVFSGAWTLTAAEAVCRAEGTEEPELLDVISGLVDKSLVQEQIGVTPEPRFRMLETIRDYALERLSQSPEVDQVRRRHADYYLGLAETAESGLRGPGQAVWYGRLEAEHDDLRQALLWWETLCTASHSPEARVEALECGLRMAGALWSFWWVHGHTREGREWLAALFAADTVVIRPGVRVKALAAAGWMEVLRGDFSTASKRLQESLKLAKATSDLRGVAYALSGLGTISRYRGQHGRARTKHEASLRIRRRLGDPYDIASALGDLGVVAYLQRDYQVAYASHEESLVLSRQVGDWRGIGRSLGNMASVVFARGDFIQAEALSRESLLIWQQLGDRWAFASSLERLAGLAAAEGKSHRALRLAGAAEALRETCGTPLAPAGQAELNAWLESAQRGMEPRAARSAWAEGRAMSDSDAISYGLDVVASPGWPSAGLVEPVGQAI